MKLPENTLNGLEDRLLARVSAPYFAPPSLEMLTA